MWLVLSCENYRKVDNAIKKTWDETKVDYCMNLMQFLNNFPLFFIYYEGPFSMI